MLGILCTRPPLGGDDLEAMMQALVRQILQEPISTLRECGDRDV